MSDFSDQLAKGVYFVSPEGILTHNAGCLIEGLLDLGVPVYTNAKELTSRQVSMPLKGRDLTDFHADLQTGYATYIVDITLSNSYVPLDGIEDSRVSYLNTSDTSVFCRVPDSFLLFLTHENRFADKGGRRQPITFGPSNWLIAQTETLVDYSGREDRILRNFRPTLSQGVRALLDLSFEPLLAKQASIDSTLYTPGDYLAALKTSSACLAYGGDFYAPIMHSDWFAKHQNDVFDQHTFKRIDRDALVLRWDSWRFWEALVSGCIAIHLDFEKYGFDLPVLPEAWIHYAPIDLDNIEQFVEELFDRKSEWSSISDLGRKWAIENYAPKPAAERVFTTILNHTG